jgi:hypothetical protein
MDFLRKQISSLSEDRRSQLRAFRIKKQLNGQGQYFIENPVVEQYLKKFPVLWNINIINNHVH